MLFVVTGPPCAGKSTWCAERMRDGDVVVDFDAIATALGSRSSHDAPDEVRGCAFAARDAAIGHALARAGDSGADFYVIHTSPTARQVAAYEEAGATFVALDPGMVECLRRAGADGRPGRTAQAIREWYENRKEGHVRMFKDFSPVGFKDAANGEEEHTFEAYAATFDREPDSYGDVIAKGAFADTLREHEEAGRRIPLLFGHEMGDPDYSLGYVDAMEDERGLKVVGHIFADTPKGETVYAMLRRGLVDRMSFAYDVREDGDVELEDGTKAHELRKLDLFEVSVVTVPANRHAEVTEVKADGRSSEDAEDELAAAFANAKDALVSINDSTGLWDTLRSLIEFIDMLIGDGGDPAHEGDGDGGDEGEDGQGNGGEPEDPGDDAKSLAEVGAKYARFIN